ALGGPSAVGRTEESDAGDPVALVHAEADQVLAEGLRERPGAGETTRHPPVAESGVLVALQLEHAAADDHMGGIPPAARVTARLALVGAPQLRVQRGAAEVVGED